MPNKTKNSDKLEPELNSSLVFFGHLELINPFSITIHGGKQENAFLELDSDLALKGDSGANPSK